MRLNSIQVLNATNKIAYGNRMVGKLNLRNQRTSEYKGKIKIHLWVEDENSSSTYWSSSSIIKDVIIPGSRTLNVDFNFENLNYNRHYYFTVRYVATDSYIDNGQLWNNDLKFFVSPGINYWRTTGTLSGLACGTTFNVPLAACGVLFGDVTPKTIKKNKNPNTIYAFQGDNITLPTGSDAINNIVTNGVADSIQFVDDYAFYSPVTFTASHATYSYTFPVGEDSVHWHGITLPFTAKIANIDGVDYELDSEYNHFFVYEFSAIDNDNTPMFTPVTEMRGNAPYIVACDSLLFGKTIIFKGDNVTINQNGTTKIVTSSNAYNQYGQTLSTSLKNVYVLNEAGTAYELVTSASVNALDTYFTTSLPENACLQSIILPEIPRDIPIVDGIQNIENNMYTNSKDIYNLAGQRVGTLRNNQIKANNLRPGIYVVDGKKILLR